APSSPDHRRSLASGADASGFPCLHSQQLPFCLELRTENVYVATHAVAHQKLPISQPKTYRHMLAVELGKSTPSMEAHGNGQDRKKVKGYASCLFSDASDCPSGLRRRRRITRNRSERAAELDCGGIPAPVASA